MTVSADEADRDRAASPRADQLADVVPLVTVGSAGPVPGPGYRLPAFWSSFVGRSAEVAELTSLLHSTRLVSVVGPGGMGKTRLAVEVAERVAPGRAFFLDLSPLHEPTLVAEEVAAAFGLGELRGRDLAQLLSDELRASALLLLDNCEHLVEACAELVHRILLGCPTLQVLVTSRQRLRVAGEEVWSVPALTLPVADPSEVSVEGALETAAVQLFCQRAREVGRTSASSAANLPAVVEICQRLDGNPLAIELAAACTDVLTPSEIATRLEDRFALLQGGNRSASTRHQTLDAALAWTDDLLAVPERRLLRRLSVFEGPFGLDAAEQVCVGDGIDPPEVLGLMSALVAKSLVAADTSGPSSRYRLLETIRHHAAAGLAAAAEAATIGERHATWCLELSEQASEADDLAAWLAERHLGPELVQDNGRAAMAWCLANERFELALRLVAGQVELWQARGRFAEARDWLERVSAAGASAPAALRAAVLHDAGFVTFLLGDFDACRAHLHDSLRLWAESGDGAGIERTQGLLSFVSAFGDEPASLDELEAVVDEVRPTGDEFRLCEALIACGHARLFRGEPLAARGYLEEIVAVAGRQRDDKMVANALVGLGSASLGLGDYEAAEHALHQGVEMAAACGQLHIHAMGMTWLAELTRLTGDQGRAHEQFSECLRVARPLGAPYPLAFSLLGLGRVVLDDGDVDAALPLLEEAVVVAGAGRLFHLVAAAQVSLGEAAVAAGDVTLAAGRFDEVLATAGKCGDRASAASATYHLAQLARGRDDLGQAATLHHEALRERHETADLRGVADSLDAVAGVAVARDEAEACARLFGAAEALRHARGFPRCPRQRDGYDADIALLAQSMASDAVQAAWIQGTALGAEEAVAYAMRGRGPRCRPEFGPASLTPAEREVALLVAEGLTNPEIADRLFISPRTVQSHLRSVFAKLQVSSRREMRNAMADWHGAS